MRYSISSTSVALRETPYDERPRERLERLGSEALTDKELLMLLIGSGNARRPVDEIAGDLLQKLDSNPGITAEEIQTVPGLGRAKASAIGAALELGRRRCRSKGRVISSPGDIFREIRHFASREQELLLVVPLNGAHEAMETIVATMGLLNRTIVHPREVFSEAIRRRAAAIAIAHNHPSGNVDPSEEDKDVTKRLVKAGEILGVKVLDHVMFTLLIQSGF